MSGETDERVLRAVGSHFSSLLSADFAVVCRASAASLASRSRTLTAMGSSRWAGAITREAERLYKSARSAQRTALRRTRAAIRAICGTLALPLQGDARLPAMCRSRRHGYRSQSERAMKQRRLQILEAKAARLHDDLAAGRVHVCRGGKKLFRHRHYLAKSGLTADAWREQWDAARTFIHANGETKAPWGNYTICVYPNNTGSLPVEINLPPHLRHLANAPRGRYRLQAKPFAYRTTEWTNHVKANRACAYDIAYDVDKRRWYLDASFTPELLAVPEWSVLSGNPALRVLAIDLNGDHLACCVVDRTGNPVRLPWNVPLNLVGLSASTRDGHLRGAISTLLYDAHRHHCQAIVCEFLDLEDARAALREDHPAPRVRAAMAGLPTKQFRNRLTAMAARCGLAVVSVDPKNSSAWGAEHWQRPLKDVQPTATVHHAAAVVLGRRALGHGARRRDEQPAPHQRMEATPVLVGVGAADHLPGRDGAIRARGPHPPPAAARLSRRGCKTGAGNGKTGWVQATQDRWG
jgi:hypothetical protein